MENQKRYLNDINTPEYDKHFWNYMRGDDSSHAHIEMGENIASGAHSLPHHANGNYVSALAERSIFRRLGTVVKNSGHASNVYVRVTENMAMWAPPGGAVPVYDELDNFDFKDLTAHKAAVLLRLDKDFIDDNKFNIEKHITNQMARSFAKVEEFGFINGDGKNSPVGITADDGGADIGVTANGSIAFDDITKLYFSLDPEFRQDGVWLMNDETALALKLLKDQDGLPLWNHNSDTLLGKPVHIAPSMPSGKPVAFGDLSYYWIYESYPLSVKRLTEKFAMHDQIGYLGYEYVGGRLTRTDAVKVIQVN